VRAPGSAAAAAALCLATALAACASNGPPATNSSSAPSHRSTSSATVPVLPGVSTNPPPWMAVSAHLVERLRAIGLPPPGVEVIAEHLHVNLVVVVHGKRVRVPAAVGFDDRGGLAEIHTHDHSGTIHLEAKRDRGFTLGMVFAVWGVHFTPDCLGAECASGDDRVRVFVNGEGPVPGDPTALPSRTSRSWWSRSERRTGSPIRCPLGSSTAAIRSRPDPRSDLRAADPRALGSSPRVFPAPRTGRPAGRTADPSRCDRPQSRSCA